MLLVKYTSNKLQQLLSDMSSSLYKILIIAIILSMVIAALFAIIMASITVNPINVMIKGTEIIGAGDLDYVIPLKRNDELGLLSDYLNDMTGKIKEAKDTEIEQKKQDEQLAIAIKSKIHFIPNNPSSMNIAK